MQNNLNRVILDRLNQLFELLMETLLNGSLSNEKVNSTPSLGTISQRRKKNKREKLA